MNMSSRSKWSLWTLSCNGVGVPPLLKSARRVDNPLLYAASFQLLLSVQLTDQFEGSLIRVFRRLGELLRQMAQAAKVIGNSELKEKFEKASEMLERPNSVIFCSSLYL